MKSLLFLMTLSASLFIGIAEAPIQTHQDLNMQLESDMVFQKMVKIYDYQGSLVREIPLDDVANNKISVMDHMILEESDFAFDYHGDYYYFGDSENIQAVVN
ncbi:MAG: hypothetical protein RLN88_15630 [Ekhidna sp.]|uniref:hypothetical protein n=1 Tax=Ekhidna sp. TaxID=2608089 RepID=UPI0032EF6BBE